MPDATIERTFLLRQQMRCWQPLDVWTVHCQHRQATVRVARHAANFRFPQILM